ncbi:hypothetical protein L6452_32095 [Arctium lappa]|uniref:Uncharacterized protein n=1 Tax=Arctium lappa TaxID=4217 RepID=A0ACB8Z485_ARCLA|nr:hypothetical protein L6452_32095 [Arctium lappa]
MQDVFAGGTDTSTATIEWSMTELMKHPVIMQKVQAEVISAFKGKTSHTVVGNNVRLTVMIYRSSNECLSMRGHVQLIPNTEPDSLKPERFEKTSVDFMGNDYQFIPFGSGSRICFGIYFGLRTLELFLAQMLNNYNWNLPRGLNPSNLDTTETLTGGVLVVKKDPLHLIPTPYSSVD